MKKNEVKFMLQASIDSDYATIDSSARIEFELFKFTVKGALLEIVGYSTVKNLHSYTEDRISRILLVRQDIEIRNENQLNEDYVNMTDDEILRLYSYEIPLENCKLAELNNFNSDYERTDNSLGGFKAEIDLSTITKNKPLKEGKYDVYIIHEQL